MLFRSTVGLPNGVEARIDQGRLFIKGPTVFVNDWYDTGDLAEQDPAGYYKIIGRSRDQINVRGIKVNPASLEQQLLAAVLGVTECAVFGTHSVKCIYVGSATADEIIAFLTKLGSYCRPTLVQSMASIPLSPSGKVSRTFLNSLYE